MKTRNGKVGLIGVGKIGLPICRTLLSDGWHVVVCEESAARLQKCLDLGASFADKPVELSPQCDIILLCLPDPDIVTEVIIGKSGLLATNAEGVLIVDLSTNSPERALALGEACRQQHCTFLDAPLSGGVWRAELGTLTVMVGGSPEDFDRAKPVLEAFGSVVIHVGPHGHGAAAKLIHNMLGEIQVQSIAEAFCLASKLKLDLGKVYLAISNGMAASRVLTDLYRNGALFGITDVNITIDNAAKDQELLLTMASEAGIHLTFSPDLFTRLRKLQEEGLGRKDVTRTLELFESIHGVTARIDPDSLGDENS